MLSEVTKDRALRRLIKTYPKLLSKESLDTIIGNRMLSMEGINEAYLVVDTNENKEVTIDPVVEQGIKSRSVSDFKLQTALDVAKDDDRNLYDEFLRVDQQRSELISKIAGRYQSDVNSLIGSIKSVPGVNSREIDNLVKTDIVATAYGITPTISNTRK